MLDPGPFPGGNVGVVFSQSPSRFRQMLTSALYVWFSNSKRE